MRPPSGRGNDRLPHPIGAAADPRTHLLELPATRGKIAYSDGHALLRATGLLGTVGTDEGAGADGERAEDGAAGGTSVLCSKTEGGTGAPRAESTRRGPI